MQGRARFQLYQKLLALLAACIQAVGQLTYIRPFVPDWDVSWLALNSLTLVAGAMVLVHVGTLLLSGRYFAHCIFAVSSISIHKVLCSNYMCGQVDKKKKGFVGAQVADTITELKLGNGTSILITANIASALPASVGAAVQQASDKDASSLPIYALAFFLTTLGIVYVQEVRLRAVQLFGVRYVYVFWLFITDVVWVHAVP